MFRSAILASTFALTALAQAANVDVVAGDKVRLDGELVQLVDIDSPELCQPGGIQAREVLAALLDGTLTYETTGRSKEGARQIRLYVDGREVNQSLVQLGWAWTTTRSPSDRYAFAQSVAKADRIGLWAYENPVPPWQWNPSTHESNNDGCDQVAGQPLTPPAKSAKGVDGKPMRLRG